MWPVYNVGQVTWGPIEMRHGIGRNQWHHAYHHVDVETSKILLGYGKEYVHKKETSEKEQRNKVFFSSFCII